jgi:hypothetical protein
MWYNAVMDFAPQQDWVAYENRTRDVDVEWVRNSTPAERFAIYEDCFRTLIGCDEFRGDVTRLEERHWKDKLALREKMVTAFRILDEFRFGHSSPDNAG